MSTIRGRYVEGKVMLDTPADWAEGTEVTVTPAEEYVGIGMREEDWPTTPEGIAELIARMDKLEPFLTPEEFSVWQQQRAKDKEAELALWKAQQSRVEGRFQ